LAFRFLARSDGRLQSGAFSFALDEQKGSNERGPPGSAMRRPNSLGKLESPFGALVASAKKTV